MTAQERTERLLLAIAERRGEDGDDRQFNAVDFDYLAARHGVSIGGETIQATLVGLAREGKLIMMGAFGQRPRFRITIKGAKRLEELNKLSEDEYAAPAPQSANDQVAAEHRERGMVLCVSEKALDGWWRALCDEMKADVFTTYLESFDDSEAEAG